jgi:hypothetical protein
MQILHVSKDSMLKDLVKDRIDSIKPRKEGLSYITDKLYATDADSFEILSPMIDVVKIYGVVPLLVPQEIIQKRIKFYHDHNILVSTGSTITCYRDQYSYYHLLFLCLLPHDYLNLTILISILMAIIMDLIEDMPRIYEN